MVSAEEHAQVLAEELEVLESIYTEELEKVTPEQLRIRIVPEDYEEGKVYPVLSLEVRYTPDYPDAVPEMAVRVIEDANEALGAAPSEEDAEASTDADASAPLVSDARAGVQQLRAELDQVAEDSLGMPMVFTLASHLRESLTTYLQNEAKAAEERASRQRDAEIAAEEEKFRGTAVTAERFLAWRVRFMQEQQARRDKAEAEKMAAMSNKEREEYKRYKQKPTGRELFSKQGTVEEEKDADDSVKEVDWSLYDRAAREQQARDTLADEEEQEGLVPNDSDEE
ncbi:Protein gir2 [Malassezia furfur]|uniref:Protein gir2 n=1 Tax=Malassezia furfur TaxID=55194 RepID=A0ABY8ET78_MALFU|nr:GIR2 [Malassezia furfur]WFD48747.1 Protein gir2 [Malassezia furfur]